MAGDGGSQVTPNAAASSLPSLAQCQTDSLQAVAATAAPIFELGAFQPPSTARPIWGELVQLLRRLGDPSTPWVGQLGQIRLWYEPYLEELYEVTPARKADLEELEAIAAQFPAIEAKACEMQPKTTA